MTRTEGILKCFRAQGGSLALHQDMLMAWGPDAALEEFMPTLVAQTQTVARLEMDMGTPIALPKGWRVVSVTLQAANA